MSVQVDREKEIARIKAEMDQLHELHGGRTTLEGLIDDELKPELPDGGLGRLVDVLDEPDDDSITKHSCLDHGMVCAGWSFDLLTVTINICDVTSDILVAIQFAKAEQWTWFWLVVSSLMLANIVYTIAFVEIVRHEVQWLRKARDISRAFIYPPVFIFAQFLPFINWFMSSVIFPRLRGSSEITHANKFGRAAQRRAQATYGSIDKANIQNRAAREELEAIENSNKIAKKMQAALESHFKAHCMFYIESAVEAAPQAVIQLLAISFLGEASVVQVLSLCLSLFSITAKAFVIARSFDVRVFIARYMMAAFDVFATFYIFASLISKDGPKNVHAGGDVYFSYLSVIWLGKLVVYLIFAAIVAIAFALYVVLFEGVNNIKELCLGIGVGIAGVGLTLPGLIVCETCKLTWLSLLAADNQPPPHRFEQFALIYQFCSGDTKDHSKFRFLAEKVCEGHEAKLRQNAVYEAQRKRIWDREACRKEADELKHRPLHTFANRTTRIIRRELLLSNYEEMTKKPSPPVRDDGDDPDALARVTALVEDEETYVTPPSSPSPGRLFLDLYPDQILFFKAVRILRAKRSDDRHIALAVAVAFILLAVGQTYSLLYPVINASLYYSSHNLLQKVTLFAASGALLISLALSPFTYRYIRFCLVGRFFWRETGGVVAEPYFENQHLSKWIAEYYSPSHTGVLQNLIPVEVVTHDVLGIVGEYLNKGDVEFNDLGIKECLALQRKVAERDRQVLGADLPPLDE